MTTPNTNANRQIARAAGTVMFAILFGQLAGLARGIIVANTFGASPELDAFFAANRVSETLFLLVAGGALGSAFIPTFTGLLAKGDKDSAWRLASALAHTVTLTLSLLAALIAFFAPQVVRFALAPGLSANPEIFALTVSLLRIQLISAVLFGLGGLIVGILNAHQIFLVPALTSAMYQLGIIFGALFLAPSMGIYGLAWGVVIGAVLYLFVQLPSLLKLVSSLKSPFFNYQLRITNDSNVRTVLLLMLPRLLGVAVVQLNFWVNTNLASNMEVGSVTSLAYAFSLMLMAQAAIAQSVAIAAMPTFSAQHALGKLDEMRASLAASLRGILLMAVPASVGLMILRVPLISFLYQRGEFDSHDVQLVAWALLWFAAGLVGHSIMEVLTRAFYAQQDTKTPVIIGTIAMGLNVLFSILFSRWFAQIGWFPLGGLALANSLATALEATALFIFMRKRLNGIEGKSIANGAWRVAVAALGMGVGLMAWIQLSLSQTRWLVTLGGVLIGGVIYGAGVVLLKVPEVKIIFDAVARRLLRSRNDTTSKSSID
ncbi:MAG: murein biosynthesis integral membrane protein MurJ [Anaerolineae bacterium]|nr:MAG: murein biosynthesis integral membrane protein MurJ [Anaerolineae bacterium]WKZ45532.1 MAG: murein biosynthesis integral membrane protein MurJ [Anaerolineales bacterium]